MRKAAAFISEMERVSRWMMSYASPGVGLKRQLSRLPSKAPEDLEIEKDSVTFVGKIKERRFGDIWHGRIGDVIDVAVKVFDSGYMDLNVFLRELQILKNLSHPNILKLEAICTQTEPFLLITEFMPHGSLLDYMPRNTMTIGEAIEICQQILKAMMYLEDQRIVHRDLSARNVLIGSDISCVKISDFGLARRLKGEGDGVYHERHGAQIPIRWTAPEAISEGFTVKSDVWSFGVLLYEIMTHGQIPYPELANEEVIDHVLAGHRMERPSECPLDIYVEIILRCWEQNPGQRPTFREILDFLDNYFCEGQ